MLTPIDTQREYIAITNGTANGESKPPICGNCKHWETRPNLDLGLCNRISENNNNQMRLINSDDGKLIIPFSVWFETTKNSYCPLWEAKESEASEGA